ncbi:MAG: ABC transporter permease [Acidobacteriota bacterium]
MKYRQVFLNAWVWRMAWRDSRSSRGRLFLFISSIFLGVAALVAISSFGVNLEEAIDRQAKTLLGADLSLSSRAPFNPEAEDLLASLGGRQSRQTSFSSMAYFPRADGLRLAQVRAVEGGFPYYGSLETEPPAIAGRFQQGPNALVDKTLMLQFGARIGDRLRLGRMTFRITGKIVKIPGESLVFSTVAPRVLIPMRYLRQTGLIQLGSRVTYRSFFQFQPATDVQEVVKKIEPRLKKLRIRYDTVEKRKQNLGRSFANLYRFLNLVGFIALLLGCIGVAGAIHLYIKQKRTTVAIVRCLGGHHQQAFAVYLIQAAVMGLTGAVAGSLLGMGIQVFLPRVLADFLPMTLPFSISWGALLKGAGIGLGMSLLFALLPLLPVRRISPLMALRADYENTPSAARDPLSVLVCFLIAGAIFVFALAQSKGWVLAISFLLGLGVAFGLLGGISKLMTLGAKKFFPASWSYVWRQGLANLYRPLNQTPILMLSLGLGTFLIVTLYFIQGTLLSQAALTGSGSNPNLVLFDVQSDQKQAVRELLTDSFGLPILQEVPIVTMRLTSVNGTSVEKLREDPHSARSRWALTREYRSTYRRNLVETEQIVAGVWQGKAPEPSRSVPVSLEENLARELGVGLGERLVFDVQGVPIECRVASLRKVNWQRVQPNFFALFPTGVLEEAPQFHVFVTRVESDEMSARLQRSVVKKFPNVSTIDLTLILTTVNNILDRVSFVIRFMALFSIFTGFTVLIGAVATSRYQRMRESVLLRTLGASRGQILRIMMIEYLFLGSLAALTGLILATAAAWSLAHFVFETPFSPEVGPVLAALVAVVTLTLLIGMVNSRGVLTHPPLQILRREDI